MHKITSTLTSHQNLLDLIPGQKIKGVYAVRSVQRGTNDRGPKISLTLGDATGTRRATKWTAEPHQTEDIVGAEIVEVIGTVKSDGQYSGEINIDSISVLDPSDWPLDGLLPGLPDDHDYWKRRLTELIESVADPHLKGVLQNVFTPEFRQKFEEAYAAKAVHHAYRGGLLRHTVEVAMISDRICDIHPDLHRDLVVTGALLHDAAKVYEMQHDNRAGEYTEMGVLVGHVVGGIIFLNRAISGIPQTLRWHLSHLIASHHDRPEYGAAKEPATPEAHVLAHADAISAHATIGLDLRNEALPGEIAVYRNKRQWCVTDPLPAARRPTVSAITGELMVRLPLLGPVAAGLGEDAEGEPEETKLVAPPAQGADFLARVTGDSMNEAGILDGDLVFVKKTSEAAPGEIIVAWLPGSGNVIKRFGGDQLESANPSFPALPLTEEVRLQGRVTGVLREF